MEIGQEEKKIMERMYLCVALACSKGSLDLSSLRYIAYTQARSNVHCTVSVFETTVYWVISNRFSE